MMTIALAAPGRSPEIPESADVYGWLIGSWELDVYHHRPEQAGLRSKGEAHFEWALEGRAVQDVWIVPSMNLYGTTIRIWDPSIQAWRVTWFNPVTGSRDELTGRWSGKDVVQIGTHLDGTPIRWIFTEITPGSFHWIGEALQPDAQTWKIQGEFRATRMR